MRRVHVAGRVPGRVAGLVMGAFGLTATAVADTLHVPADFPTIQAGIDAAKDGDTVVVADGVYGVLQSAGYDFLGKAITVRSANGPQTCTIDCEMDGRGFLFQQGEGPDSVLEGFSIVRGLGLMGGGGILIRNDSSPTIRSCIVTDCYGFDWGGGVAIRSGGSATIEHCVFSENYTDFFGGAIFLDDGSATVTDCVLNANVGLAFGGGFYLNHHSELTAVRCTVVGNIGCGADLDAAFVEATFIDCLFAGNECFQGGGIRAGSLVTPVVINCTIVGNTGGGIDGGAEIANCIVRGNVDGSGEPAQLLGDPDDYTVVSSNVEGGWTGPGANNIDADPLFAGGVSGAWTADPAYDAATNLTTYTDASAAFEPGALVGRQFNPNTQQPRVLYVAANGATTISVTGELQQSLGPALVVNAGDAYQVIDLRLISGSPSVDAGDNAAVPAGQTQDLDGNPRFVDDPGTPDSGQGDPPIVDMGAYERQATIPGDVDGDGGVGVVDLVAVIVAWGPCPRPCPPSCPADLDGDCDVDVTDLVIVLTNWGP